MSAQLAVVEKSESLDPSSQPSPDLVGPEVVVLKFGSSILRSPAEAPLVASAVYGHVRAGRKVVAVVSAFGGATDRLLGEARALGLAHSNDLLPGYVALGEEKSAALVAIACDQEVTSRNDSRRDLRLQLAEITVGKCCCLLHHGKRRMKNHEDHRAGKTNACLPHKKSFLAGGLETS